MDDALLHEKLEKEKWPVDQVDTPVEGEGEEGADHHEPHKLVQSVRSVQSEPTPPAPPAPKTELGALALVGAVLIFSSNGAVYKLMYANDSEMFSACNVLCGANLIGLCTLVS